MLLVAHLAVYDSGLTPLQFREPVDLLWCLGSVISVRICYLELDVCRAPFPWNFDDYLLIS